MADKSEMILKSVGKIIFVEMTMPVVFKLTQTGNLERYILVSEDKLKTNKARLGKVFAKRKLFAS